MKKKSYVWLAASLLCMAVIFVFSSFPAEQSSGMSNPLVDFVVPVIENWFGVTVPVETVEYLYMLIRKAAHLLIFLTLGVCVTNTVRRVTENGKRIFMISLCWCSLYAATDELHQYFVPGRACMWQDWMLDTIGALIGIGIVTLTLHRRGIRRDKALHN